MEKQPVVLHLCSIKGRGGTGYMASRLCRLAALHGAKIIVGSCKGSKVEERARAAGLPLLEGLELRRGFRPLALLNDILRIRKCIKENSVNIIHAWHSIEYWTAWCAVWGTDVKLVRTRGLVTPIKPSLVNHMIHKRTAFVHATCKVIEENYRRGGFDMDKVKLVYDGVDTERFNPDIGGGHIRREAGIPDQAPVIANIGRLEAIKGHKYLLEALTILRKRLPGFHMLIAGDGSLRNGLEEMVTASGLRAQVHFLGVRKDIPGILCASNMYALCSIGSEGSSRATQEAMACGLPVVATDVGMLPDIVKEGETGFIVSPRSPESMADALYKILSDSSKLKEMGWNSRKWVEEDFDENIFAKRILDLYKSVI